MLNRKFAVLGLGTFGKSLASTLAKNGAEVIAIDEKMEKVEEVQDLVDLAVQGDFTKKDILIEAGISNCDVAIIATSNHLETSILTMMNLEELGIDIIIAKSQTRENGKILERMGAKRVINPEHDMGIFFGNELSSSTIQKVINLDDQFEVIEFHPIRKWVDKTIDEVDFRQVYDVNIIAMRKNSTENLTIQIDPQYRIEEHDVFIGLTCNDKFISHFS